MELIINKAKESSTKYFDILNEQFTRKMLKINSCIRNEEYETSIIYSRMLDSIYNSIGIKDEDILYNSYFLKFAPLYIEKKVTEDIYSKYQYLVSFATLALQSKKINEIRVTLFSELLEPLEYNNFNWLQILYLETLRLYLILIRRKDGWNDINEVQSTIEKLIKVQKVKETELIKQNRMSQLETAQLVILYNTIAAIRDVCSYLSSGNPMAMDVRLSRYRDNIAESFKAGVDAKFKYSMENVIKGLDIICNNSIWKQLRTGAPRDKFISLILEKNCSKPIFELLPSQIEAFKGGIADPLKSAVIIQMHTSAGKSLLAHYLIAQSLQEDRDGRIAYVVPTRALVHQVMNDLKSTFSSLNINIVATIPAYEVDALEKKILDEDIDILVTTPEKLNLLVRSGHPCVENLNLVIVDEAHNISDKHRGLSLEFLLATIRRQKEYIKIVMLTPFIKDNVNRDTISSWLGGERGLPVYSLWKPTRQLISIVSKKSGKIYKIETVKPNNISNIDRYPEFTDEIILEGKAAASLKGIVSKVACKYIDSGAVLILAESPYHSEEQAKALIEEIPEEIELTLDMKLFIKFVKEELGENHLLVNCLSKGIAFHHSGLSEEVRVIIEKLISTGDIKYIIGTTTLAQGMNFPVSTVIVRSLTFPVGRGKKREEMSSEVFWNIAGRAGRVFKDFVGRIIFISRDEEDETKIKKFLGKSVEGINSAIFETIRNLDEFSVKFNRKLIADNPQLTQLFQFISHTLKIQNEKDELYSDPDFAIDEILRLSLAYKQLSDKGDSDRKKLLAIAKKYLNNLRSRKNWVGTAGLVDKTGFSSMTIDYLMSRKNELPDFKSLSIEDFNGNLENMTELITILGEVPEIKLGIGDRGTFAPELVAKITSAWVQGQSFLDIYNKILKDYHNDIRDSIKYIYQTITSKLSWGMGAMQTISLSGEEVSDVTNLPSMIFYGVPSDTGVLLRMAGIPRSLAVKISEQNPNISEKTISKTKEWLMNLPDSQWGSYTKGSKLTGSEWKRIWEIIEGK